MMRRKYNPAIRTTLIYLVFGVLWILLSDKVVEISLPKAAQAAAQSIKGLVFVAASALLIYGVTHNEVKALKESQGRLKGVLDAAPDAMIIVRQDGKIATVNRQVERVFGYSENEMHGQSMEMLVPERFRSAHRGQQIDFFSSPHRRGDSRPDLYALRKDGSEFPAEIHLDFQEFGGENLAIASVRDITERKRAEEEQFRLMRVLEASLNEIYLFDEKTLRFKYVNQGARDNLGYSMDELNGLTPVDLKPEFSMETFMDKIAPLALGEKENLVFETIHRRKDGTTYPVEIHLQLVKTGESSLYVAIIHDMTERKQMEQSLRESEARFRSLVEQMPAITYVAALDEKSTTLYVSPQINQYIDPSIKQQAKAVTWIDFLHPLDRRRVLEELRQSREDNKPFTSEYRIITSHGEVIWFRDTASLVCDESGKPLCIQGLMVDITEQKQAEEQIEMLARFPAENPNPVMRGDLSGRLLYANPASAPLLELWNCRVGELLPLDWHERIVSVYASKAEDGLDVQCGERVFSARITPIESKGYINIYATDVTERRQAEKALIVKNLELQELATRLEQSRNMLGLIIESAPVRVFWKDLESRYLGCNSLFAQDAGLETVEQVVGKVDEDLYWKDMAEAFRQQEHEVIATGQPIVNQVETQELPGGGIMWINTSIVPLQSPGGQAFGVLGIYEDITERKQAEEDLKRYATRLEEAERHAQLGSWEFDVASGQGWWSKQMYRMFGFEISNTVPEFEPYLERIHPGDRQIVLDVLGEMARGQEPTSREYRTNPEFGPMRYLSPTVYTERNARGEAIRFIGTLLDITERKQAEEKVQVQLKRITALNEIDRAISASLDLHISLDVLLYEVTSQLGVDAASVLLLNPVDQSLEFVAGKGFRTNAIRETHLQIGQGLPGYVGLERRLLHIPNLRAANPALVRADLFRNEEFIEYFGVPLIAKGLLKGVLEIFNRSPLAPDTDWVRYLETLGGQAAIAIDNAQLFEDLQESHQELVTAYDATILGWSRAMDLRDKETEGHTQRVTDLTLKLAKRLGIGEQELHHIRRGALLHDIGKLGVPDQILLKPGTLTDEEWVIMRQHPSHAYNMLLPIKYLRPALDIPYCHHEKWDGTGYPRGLAGEKIPLAARIFAVIDVWDALRSDRPYRAGWSAQKTRDYIQAESGKHFDPRVVEAFLQMLDGLPELK